MLHINDLTYRVEGKTILNGATTAIPTGHKVGLVGRNGSGKTTLLRIITGDLAPEEGSIALAKNCRIGHVAQEAPGSSDTLIEWVLAADKERSALLEEADTAQDPERIAEIQLRLSDIGSHSAPARAARILAGLGFDEAAQNRACSEFSGGWRMRVALAAVLFLAPELLLLDEPTNYLDLEGAMWLENYLRTYPHTVVIVSHDRNLLNRAVSAILHLDRGRLALYSGGYDAFEEKRRQQQQTELKLKKKQDDERRRIEAFITRFRAKASKATQAQSRIKALARMQPIAAHVEEGVAPFSFPTPKTFIASPLLQFEDAAVGYEADKPVLQSLDLRIDNDDRIALLGQNGNGKSTFAKLISGRLKPMSGIVRGHAKVSFGYFAQHQLDELAAQQTPYAYVSERMPTASEAQRRARLGAFGFGIEKANNRCETLSGGEKARLLLMLAAFHGPHVLVLDEPTNHLDVDSRQSLIQALNDYNGAVIMISHDRHLIEACAERLWIVKNGTVQVFDGDLDAYQGDLLGEVAAGKKRTASASGSSSPRRSHSRPNEGCEPGRSGRAGQRRAAAEQRAAVAPLKRAMEVAERRVEELGAKISSLDNELGDAGLYETQPARAQALSIERGALVKELNDAEADWLVAMEAYEEALGSD